MQFLFLWVASYNHCNFQRTWFIYRAVRVVEDHLLFQASSWMSKGPFEHQYGMPSDVNCSHPYSLIWYHCPSPNFSLQRQHLLAPFARWCLTRFLDLMMPYRIFLFLRCHLCWFCLRTPMLLPARSTASHDWSLLMHSRSSRQETRPCWLIPRAGSIVTDF